MSIFPWINCAAMAITTALAAQSPVTDQRVIPADLQSQFQILPYRCLLECPESFPTGHWKGLYFKEIWPGVKGPDAKLKAIRVKVAPCDSGAFGMLSGPKIIGGSEVDLQWVIRGLPEKQPRTKSIPTVRWMAFDTKPTIAVGELTEPLIREGLFNGKPFKIIFRPADNHQDAVEIQFEGKNQELGQYGGNLGEAGLGFVGDLDGDGIPDLIITMSYHYAASEWYLFLSSKASKNEIVKKVAHYFEPGD